jgi:phosphatidylethanolamine/phosphatidyl-N-methylethanolamine N-methyltransferase
MLSLVRSKPSKKPVEKKKRHRHRSDRFIAAWLRSPLKVGAVVPSSRTLAKAMAKQVDVSKPGVVIELGPGTGVVTHALLKAGIAHDKLLVIERDKRMYGVMAAQFPDLDVICADAMELTKTLAERKVTKVSAIVSSLPLLSMPKQVRGAIEKQMAEAIGDEGVIVQFTYGARSPLPKTELFKYRLWGRRVRSVLANIPPAHVWVYKRERRKTKR